MVASGQGGQTDREAHGKQGTECHFVFDIWPVLKCMHVSSVVISGLPPKFCTMNFVCMSRVLVIVSYYIIISCREVTLGHSNKSSAGA